MYKYTSGKFEEILESFWKNFDQTLRKYWENSDLKYKL